MTQSPPKPSHALIATEELERLHALENESRTAGAKSKSPEGYQAGRIIAAGLLGLPFLGLVVLWAKTALWIIVAVWGLW